MFDVSHMRPVDLEGADTRPFLRALIANNVDKLTQPGKALYTCMLNESGGVIDDLIVYFMREDWFRVVVNASTADKDIAWMRQVAVERRFSVRITAACGSRDHRGAGPERAREVLAGTTIDARRHREAQRIFAAEAGDLFVARTGYTGEDGFEIILPAQNAAQLWSELKAVGVAEAGLGARDTLRLEAGMNLYGNDMDEVVSPLDAGLAWTVDLKTARDFIGRGALERDGARMALVGLKLLDRGVLRSHQGRHCCG